MKSEMPDLPSCYYPPRARWYSAGLHFLRSILGRLGFDCDSVGLPFELPRLLADILLPGWAFDGSGKRWIAGSLAAGWALGLVLFFVLLGTGVGNAGLALAISLHAISAGQGFVKHLERRVLLLRLALGLALGVGLAGLAYLPASAWFCAHVALPLKTPQGVIVVNPHSPLASVQRGDWVAYRLESTGMRRNVILHEGFAIGQVLAVAGDRVQFGATEFAVNQQRARRLDLMPETGGLTLRPGTWFIWPELMVRRNTLGEEVLSQTFLDLSVVSSSQYEGRPFNRWFFRKPKL